MNRLKYFYRRARIENALSDPLNHSWKDNILGAEFKLRSAKNKWEFENASNIRIEYQREVDNAYYSLKDNKGTKFPKEFFIPYIPAAIISGIILLAVILNNSDENENAKKIIDINKNFEKSDSLNKQSVKLLSKKLNASEAEILEFKLRLNNMKPNVFVTNENYIDTLKNKKQR